jgi:hypothetical protein
MILANDDFEHLRLCDTCSSSHRDEICCRASTIHTFQINQIAETGSEDYGISPLQCAHAFDMYIVVDHW